MVIKNVLYLDENSDIKRGNILIKNKKIYIVNDYDNNDVIIDGTSLLCTSGMVNAHFHGLSTVGRGLDKDMPVNDWFNDSTQGKVQNAVFDIFENEMSKEDQKAVALKEYIDLAKQGVTFINDGGTIDNSIGIQKEAMEQVGIRGMIDTFNGISDYSNDKSDLVSFCMHLLEEEDITNDSLKELVELKKQYADTYFCTHCLETKYRKELIYKNFSMSTVELFEKSGCLDNKTVLYHCVQANSNDLDIIAKHNCAVVYNPISNLKTGAGILDVTEVLKRKISCALGTDWANTNYFDVLKTVYMLMKVQKGGIRFNAYDIFKMATLYGYRAFGYENAGIIKDGALADIILINLEDSSMMPLINQSSFSSIMHNFIVESSNLSVEHVFVNGKWIVKNKKAVLIDEEKVNKEYQEVMKKISIQVKNRLFEA